jgi:hypothetical protein
MVDLGFIGIMLAFFQLLWGFALESSKYLFFVHTDQNLRSFIPHMRYGLWPEFRILSPKMSRFQDHLLYALLTVRTSKREDERSTP